ncbi:MAG: hypothetical protein ACPGU4_03745 [Flavobacteriales bacterium]
MIDFLSRLLGKKDEPSALADELDDSWVISSIASHSDFFRWLLQAVPENSIWSIDHVFDKKMLGTLMRFKSQSDHLKKGVFYINNAEINVLLSTEAKQAILEKLDTWDFEANAIHQRIYQNNTLYFVAYDNLHPLCTWLSLSFEKDEIKSLEKKGLIKFRHSQDG